MIAYIFLWRTLRRKRLLAGLDLPLDYLEWSGSRVVKPFDKSQAGLEKVENVHQERA
jgi:hypothetical protein